MSVIEIGLLFLQKAAVRQKNAAQLESAARAKDFSAKS
jgi:hypothetical protein